MLSAAAWRRLAGLATVLLIASCYVPSPPTPGPDLPNADKLLHVLAFFGVTLAWRLGGVSALGSAGIALALILVTEIGQAILPTGRSAEVFDAVADGIGIALGLGLATRIGTWAVRTSAGKESALG